MKLIAKKKMSNTIFQAYVVHAQNHISTSTLEKKNLRDSWDAILKKYAFFTAIF